MLYRVMCVPGKDVVMTTPPTYGMYKVTANVNDVGVLEVPLITMDGAFQLDEEKVGSTSLAGLLTLCSDERTIHLPPRSEDAVHLLAGQSNGNPDPH